MTWSSPKFCYEVELITALQPRCLSSCLAMHLSSLEYRKHVIWYYTRQCKLANTDRSTYTCIQHSQHFGTTVVFSHPFTNENCALKESTTMDRCNQTLLVYLLTKLLPSGTDLMVSLPDLSDLTNDKQSVQLRLDFLNGNCIEPCHDDSPRELQCLVEFASQEPVNFSGNITFSDNKGSMYAPPCYRIHGIVRF